MYIIAPRQLQEDAIQLIESTLMAANYPTRDFLIHSFGSDSVEIVAVLMDSAVDRERLDKLTAELEAQPCITQVFWSPSTSE